MRLLLLIGLNLLPMSLYSKPLVVLSKESWHEQDYGSVKPNQIEFSNREILINVQSSSSALIYKLPQHFEISSFEVELNIDGEMQSRNDNQENPQFEEDSYFRMGLVAVGDTRLGFMDKMIAPKWVKQLFTLVPDDQGLDKIFFFNLIRNAKLIGRTRAYPKTKYIVETAVAKASLGDQKFTHMLPRPIKTSALWISADGDQSRSRFTTKIKKIVLQ